MSMNLNVEATRNAFTQNAKGKQITFTDRRTFEFWQTPTEVTKSILSKTTQDEKVKAYVAWAESISMPYEDNVYDYSCGFDANFEYPVVGKKLVNPAKEHAEELQSFLQTCHEEGFSINFYMM